MGTPEFAVPSLRKILEEGYPVAAVVTSPDRPAGRGRSMRKSPVKLFAEERSLKILQPDSLKDPSFIEELSTLSPDIQVVVAFRMLPGIVWKLPRLATFNLHASLLPFYRGAAPVNWAIIRGERETGLTTFLIDEKIDTGNILLQEKISITEDDDAGSLHDRMKEAGADLVIRTLRMLEKGTVTAVPQNELAGKEIKTAPKLNRETGKINWCHPAHTIRNLIRGLSPLPGAYAHLASPSGEKFQLKIFRATAGEEVSKDKKAGDIVTDSKTFLAVATADKLLYLHDVHMEGKKRMSIGDFLRGFGLDDTWKMTG